VTAALQTGVLAEGLRRPAVAMSAQNDKRIHEREANFPRLIDPARPSRFVVTSGALRSAPSGSGSKAESAAWRHKAPTFAVVVWESASA
jgi:hypothetical protein